MKIGIIVSNKVERILKLKILDLIRKENIPYLVIEKFAHFISDDDIKDFDVDYLIAINVHTLKDYKKRFCVHPCGNWNKKWYISDKKHLGGEEKTLASSSGELVKQVYLSLLKNNNIPYYKVNIECTHHGPNISKPIAFLEIGTSPQDWIDGETTEVIIKTIKDTILSFREKSNKIVIALGGDHYMQRISYLLRKSNIAVSHMCPSNNISYFNQRILNEAIKKTKEKIDFVILDLPCIAQYETKVIKILKKANIPYRFLHDMIKIKQ